MSNFNKFSSMYHDSVDDVLDQLTDIYTEHLNSAFMDFDVELRRPAYDSSSQERVIVGKVRSVQLWLSRPNFDVPLLMCRFEVLGKDQNGVEFNECVKEEELITKIPWQKLDLKLKFTVSPELTGNSACC